MLAKNNSQFLSKDNLSLLFEVINDEYKNYILDKNAFNIAFKELIQIFYFNQIKSGSEIIHDIVNMNKKFISFVSATLEKKFNIQKQINPNVNSNIKSTMQTNAYSNNQNNSNMTNNKHDELPITSEDIKNKRLEKFDKELSVKQNEFKSAFNNNVPETPNFKSPIDEPLNEIDILTKQKMAEREKEIQTIYNNVDSSVRNDKGEFDFEIKESNEWLQYFSLPIEKKETNITSIMKSIKIKEEIPKEMHVKEEIVLQDTILKKNISWNDEKQPSIFSKLKTIDVLTPEPVKVIPFETIPKQSSLYLDETVTRMESKIDKLTSEINKCYDVITLLFNTIMSSNNLSASVPTEVNNQNNTVSEEK
jgi:hypothetical protein